MINRNQVPAGKCPENIVTNWCSCKNVAFSQHSRAIDFPENYTNDYLHIHIK